MKKEYKTPEIQIDEYELDNFEGNLCSGGGTGNPPVFIDPNGE